MVKLLINSAVEFGMFADEFTGLPLNWEVCRWICRFAVEFGSLPLSLKVCR